ncbi:peroxisomal long-chain fatty acid import protein 1 [Scheffersomyces amazonensis]|uniref:peroxisomal long-chain fatty acid import protein 1 n=1 Tax=Scheffersomyces amazonensis TaxID=1078765 RepID=UPI00315D3CB0
MIQRPTNSLAISLFNVYKSNRSLFLNTAYIILLTAAFSRATNTGDPESKKSRSSATTGTSSEIDEKKHPKISKESFRRLAKAVVPSIFDSTILHLTCHTVLLVLRALLTIRVANLDGQLVGALVSKKLRRFSKLLLFWMFLGIPASVVNGLLSLTKQKLTRSIRINITNSIMNDYLPDNLDANYYSLIHLSQGKIKDPNQRISTDVARLSYALSSLPGQLLKPTLDLLLCARELSKSGVGNGEGTLVLGMLAHFSTSILRFFSPPFAKLASEKANLEGQLRSSHAKIVGNNEEIAFLRGHQRELDYIDYCYYTLERFLKNEYWKKAIHEIAQTFIVKYLWGAAGLVLCSAPIFINKYMGYEPNPNHAGDFITNRRLLMSASDSIDRLIYSRRYLLQIVGHATRVSDFQDVLHTIKNQKSSNENVIRNDDEITFDNVNLLTPADVTLIESLSFSLKTGDHLLIAGPNGSGKSSLFRMLGGLWPCKIGTITIPNSENMFYLPQRAYLTAGTLKEQIIYPHSLKQCKKSDAELIDILKVLKLNDYIDNLNEEKSWDEELSTGAQQRLAMARLYYHQPRFAVLDECTSAVAPDMEQFMYEHAQNLGITVLSVAHRPALWHFHKYLLKFDGKGNYYFGKLDAEKRLKFEQERLLLDKSLRDIPILKERLSELKKVSNAQHKKYGIK